MDPPVGDLVKHVLHQYKAEVEALNAYDPAEWEFPPDSNQLNLRETLSAIIEAPNEWLSSSREAYLVKHGRTLCRAFAWYGFELKKQLGEEWKAANDWLKDWMLERGLQWKESPAKRVDTEPNLERQLRAEVELVSKLKREFCAPYIPTLPDGEIDNVKWQEQSLRQWKNRYESEPRNES